MFNGLDELITESKGYRVDGSKISGEGIFTNMDYSKGVNLGLAFKRILNTGDPDKDFERTELGEYVNHSDNPNLKLKLNPLSDSRKLYEFITTKEIPKNTELTVDYRTFTWDGEVDFIKESPDIDKNVLYLTENGAFEKFENIINGVDSISNEWLKLESVPGDKVVNFLRRIMMNGNEVGLVFFTKTFDVRDKDGQPTDEKGAFVIVAVNPGYRGNGYATEAEDLLAEEFDIDIMYATIHEDNDKSLKAHRKAGFQEVPDGLRKKLIENNKLQTDEVRLWKPMKDNINVKKLFAASLLCDYNLYSESLTLIAEAPEDTESNNDTNTNDNQEGTDKTNDTQNNDTDVQTENNQNNEQKDTSPPDDSGDDSGDDMAIDDNFGDMDMGVEEGENPETVEKKRERYLKKVYRKMYNKYTDVINTLKNIDTTKDKKLLLDELTNDYREAIDMLIEYNKFTDDPINIQYQTLLKFRFTFMYLNNKLYTLKKLINEED